MSLINKNIILFLLFTAVASNSIIAQETNSFLKGPWDRFTPYILHRDTIISHLVEVLKKNDHIDQREISKIKNQIIILENSIKKIKVLDSLAINNVAVEYNRLTEFLEKLFISYENQVSPEKDTLVNKLLIQLEAAENRMVYSANLYNGNCSRSNREDLFFKPKNSTSKQVKF